MTRTADEKVVLMRLAETVEQWGWEADEDFSDIAREIRNLAGLHLPETEQRAIAAAQIARLMGDTR